MCLVSNLNVPGVQNKLQIEQISEHEVKLLEIVLEIRDYSPSS